MQVSIQNQQKDLELQVLLASAAKCSQRNALRPRNELKFVKLSDPPPSESGIIEVEREPVQGVLFRQTR
jgi:hypothetical protein